jgi:uncharacterized protein (DUF305 family)
MRTITMRRALLAGAAFTAAVVLTAACGTDNGNDDGTGTTPPAAGAPGEFNEADVEFAQNMIVHHEQAIEMAELAATQASDPELAELAGQISDAQEPEVTTMTGWLTAWGEPVDMPGGHEGMAMPGMASQDEMADLHGATGVEFDRMFTRLMIVHHNGAIQMASQVQTGGVNQDVQAMAAVIEQDQQAEVDRLEGILDRL